MIVIAFVSIVTPAFAEMNIDVVVDGLNNPWEMVFAPNGDIYFSERDGRVWKIENFGEAKVIQTFPKSGSYEGGTLGLALHPNFEENKNVLKKISPAAQNEGKSQKRENHEKSYKSQK